MMKKIAFVLVAIAFSTAWVYAQGPKIDFDVETYDFGEIEETGGSVEYKFAFKNTGNAPLVIQEVKPSCGCTTPSWTREPVMPGKEGHILAKYDPTNRPGAFTKSLAITSNANPNIKNIYIKGMVNPKAKSADAEYPVKIGNLRMRYRSMHLGDVTTNEPSTKKFDIYNDGAAPITFQSKVDAPPHMKVRFEPATLQAGTAGKIVITYDGKAKGDFGTVVDNFTIYTNEDKDNTKGLRTQATIKEYFPPMSAEQLAKAPKLTIESSTYDFGTIKEGQKISREFVLTNSGKSNLNIRTTKSSCSCTIADIGKSDLKPGESVNLKVTFDSSDRRGTQQKSISIYSNDPQSPTQRVILKGRVVES